MRKLLVPAFLLASTSMPALAQSCGPSPAGTLFYDNFQNGLGQWNYGFPYAPGGFTDNTMDSFHVNPNAPGMPADANTFSISPSGLSIAVKNTPPDVPPALVGNKPYLSGILTSKFSRLYGYFEIRMQTPGVGAGGSSAFWLLNTNGAWPPEIDQPEIEYFLPTGLNWGIHGPGNATPTLWTYNFADTSKGFHTLGVDWQPNTITFYAGGKATYQEPTPSNMHDPMYMLIDTLIAVPGGWVGNHPSVIHDSLKVQYVAVYPSHDAAVAAQASGGSAPCPAVASATGTATMPAPTSAAVDAASPVTPATNPTAALPVPTNAYDVYPTALKQPAPSGTAQGYAPPSASEVNTATDGGPPDASSNAGTASATLTGTGNASVVTNGPQDLLVSGAGNVVTTGSGDDRIFVTSPGNTIDAGGGRNVIILDPKAETISDFTPSSSVGLATGNVGLASAPAPSATTPAGLASSGTGNTSVATGNTIVLPAPGTGFDRIWGFGASDQLDLTTALAGTTWDHQAASLGQFVTVEQQRRQVVIRVGGTPIAAVRGQVTMQQVTAH